MLNAVIALPVCFRVVKILFQNNHHTQIYGRQVEEEKQEGPEDNTS